MIKPMVVFLAGFVTGAVPEPVHGDGQTIAKAQEYLTAYARMDLPALEALYADDAVFNDPTSADVPGIGGPFVWRGRAEILARIRDWKRSVRSLDYDVERVYEASGHVVFVGNVKPLVETPQGTTQFVYPIVTIVSLVGGRVVEHRDYTNYAAGRAVPAQGEAR